MMRLVQIPEQALMEHPVAENDDENMDSVQDLRADPVLTEPGQLNQSYPVQAGQVLVVQGPDGFSHRQDVEFSPELLNLVILQMLQCLVFV